MVPSGPGLGNVLGDEFVLKVACPQRRLSSTLSVLNIACPQYRCPQRRVLKNVCPKSPIGEGGTN